MFGDLKHRKGDTRLQNRGLVGRSKDLRRNRESEAVSPPAEIGPEVEPVLQHDPGKLARVDGLMVDDSNCGQRFREGPG